MTTSGQVIVWIYISNESGNGSAETWRRTINAIDQAEGTNIDADGKVLLKLQQTADPLDDSETFRVWADGTEIYAKTFLIPGETPSSFKNLMSVATTGNDGSQVPGGTGNYYQFNGVRYIRTTGGTGTASGPLEVNGSYDGGPGLMGWTAGITNFFTRDPACSS